MNRSLLLAFILATILTVLLFRIYQLKIINTEGLAACVVDRFDIDTYANKVLHERSDYKVEQKELEREATDGSYRNIFTDKNENIVLIEDRHSGESGVRVVSVIIKNKKVVKIIDTLTHYDIPPIEDPDARPTVTEDSFYINDSKICEWYKQGKLTDLKTPHEQEYLQVARWIVDDAEKIAEAGILIE